MREVIVKVEVEVDGDVVSARALPFDFVLACEQLSSPRTFPMRHIVECFTGHPKALTH